MRKIAFISLMLILSLGALCQQATKLQVVYFHAEHRCPTCISIEENTRKTLNTYFADQMKKGIITLQVLNVADEKNEKMVEKYEADGSGLFLTQLNGKKETTTELTNFAFSYSRNQPEKFIAGLKEEIAKRIK
jgi:hypothetical protein